MNVAMDSFPSGLTALSGAFNGWKGRRKTHISVGNVALPLHGAADNNPAQQMLHPLTMQEMAGSTYRGDPRGFRIAPSSKKNPRTHSKKPTTRLEHLAKAANIGAEA